MLQKGSPTCTEAQSAGRIFAAYITIIYLVDRLGLKNSDDQGTNFDLRAEIYKNGTLLTSGETLCITGLTRNPALAKKTVFPFSSLVPSEFNGTTDVLSLKILTRVGTNGAGGLCGGHSNAVGLRLYFDATNRPSGFISLFTP